MTVVGWRSRLAIGKPRLKAGHRWIQRSLRLVVIPSNRAPRSGTDSEKGSLDRLAQLSDQALFVNQRSTCLVRVPLACVSRLCGGVRQLGQPTRHLNSHRFQVRAWTAHSIHPDALEKQE